MPYPSVPSVSIPRELYKRDPVRNAHPPNVTYEVLNPSSVQHSFPSALMPQQQTSTKMISPVPTPKPVTQTKMQVLDLLNVSCVVENAERDDIDWHKAIRTRTVTEYLLLAHNENRLLSDQHWRQMRSFVVRDIVHTHLSPAGSSDMICPFCPTLSPSQSNPRWSPDKLIQHASKTHPIAFPELLDVLYSPSKAESPVAGEHPCRLCPELYHGQASRWFDVRSMAAHDRSVHQVTSV